MQKQIAILCLYFAMILTTCGAPVGTQPLTSTQTIGATEAPSTLTETPTPIATDTSVPAASTATLTELPSRTPSAPETCPKADEKVRPQFGPVFKGKKDVHYDARQAVLDFLNSGGNPQTAIGKLAENGVSASQLDVTADGVPEFLLSSGYYSIFGCHDGRYQTLLDLSPTADTGYEPIALVIDDLNRDGVAEIFIAQVLDYRVKYSLLAWDGTKFSAITPRNHKNKTSHLYIVDHDIYAVGQSHQESGTINGNWQVTDINLDGFKEISIKAGVNVSFFSSNIEEQITLAWDGATYIVSNSTIESTPTYTPTSTPLPFSATCDYQTPSLNYQFPDDQYLKTVEESIADFLNRGGDPKDLNSYFYITIKDLNNDEISEIVIIDNRYLAFMYIFSCINGAYKNSLDPAFENSVNSIQILSTEDLNKNGLSEIVTRTINCFLNRCGNIFIAEWDGKQFSALIRETDEEDADNFAYMSFHQNSYIKDLDNDGFPELTWIGGQPDESADPSGLPMRVETHVYKWDGKYYRPKLIEYSNPTYLFQAVQDGDHYALDGQLEKALKMYNEVLKNEKLSWWTQSRQEFLLSQAGAWVCEENKLCPQPNPDPDEKPILQAYANYRIMLTQILLGQQTEAENTYKNLISTYTADSRDNYAGIVIADLATAFWNEYKVSQNIENACTDAIIYTERHMAFLKYIGSDYHGWQMEKYRPKDICPFK